MWFMISMVYMHFGNVQPEILVYKTIYKDKASCQKVYQLNSQKVIDDLFTLKPEAKSMSITCVSRQVLSELQITNKIKKL